ncbi:ABC transporter permease [Endozoicomonas sp. Mp262]|uniref:ABC transporter permease n=1 Tax=Endozoicomonas sp. Mp262 TaxID=2919499 RepID=UPI0021DAF23A
MNTHNISLLQLLLFYCLLVIPFAFLFFFRLGSTIRELLLSMVRMTVQLALIALYLEFLFQLNNIWVNLGWLLLMVSVASSHVLGKSGLSRKHVFWVTQLSLSISTVLVLSAMLALLMPFPWYDARYLIPLAGMLLGNSLTANTLVLERFYSSITTGHDRYLADLLMGASTYEAASPFLKEALKAALSPMIASMATVGVVYLPGMMTGQILGGAEPLKAVTYQALIMVGIAIATMLSVMLNSFLSLKVGFDGFGLIRQGIIVQER